MRMARMNVYLPDDLHRAAKRQGLNVSELCQEAIAAELRRRERLAELEAHLTELDDQFGPATAEEVAEAEAWVDSVLDAAARAGRSADRRRARRSA